MRGLGCALGCLAGMVMALRSSPSSVHLKDDQRGLQLDGGGMAWRSIK